MAYARALLKLSGEALMGNQGYGIDPEIVSAIAADVAKVAFRGSLRPQRSTRGQLTDAMTHSTVTLLARLRG